MKNRNKILIGVGIVALVVLVDFYVIFPFYLAGPPTPLHHIKNYDINNHGVVVDIFDSHNKSMLKETYNLGPKESIERPKPFLLKLPLPWWHEEYTFKVTLDGEITEVYETKIYPWMMVEIWLIRS